MKRRDIVTALVVIVILVFGSRYLSRDNTPNIGDALTSPSPSSNEKELADRLGKEISDSAIKTDLRSTGEVLGTAIATKEEVSSGTKISVMADLPELLDENKYKVVIGDGEQLEVLGDLAVHKGGWLLETSTSTSESEIKKISIVEENSSVMTTIFEGEFTE